MFTEQHFSRLVNQRKTKASIYTTLGNKTTVSSNTVTADKVAEVSTVLDDILWAECYLWHNMDSN